MRATTVQVRRESLDTVLKWHKNTGAPPAWDQLLSEALATAQYLTTPWAVRVRCGLVTEQDTGEVIDPQPTGAQMQLSDTQQVTYTITALDAKGYEVDTVDFSCSIDNPDVASVTDNGNDFLVVAGNPGSAVLSFTDGTLTATEALDVVPGSVATVRVQAGEPQEQPAAEGGETPAEGGTTPDTGQTPPTDTGGTVPSDTDAPQVNPLG